MRILIAQDDSSVASKIKFGLLAENFDVDIATDGETALWYINEGNHSAIILDIMLPKINGFDVCQTMRNNHVTIPILILTNKASAGDEIDALDAGADDFLRIPFSTPVFIARVRALLRRRNLELNNVIEFGSLCYHLNDRKCFLGKQEISLTSREGKILELLMLGEGAVVSKQALLDQVWGIEFNGNPNIVDVYIGYLRRKLCPNHNHHLLQTVRGVGYRIVNQGR
jgi:DNA-binding response OmpR family regulator